MLTSFLDAKDVFTDVEDGSESYDRYIACMVAVYSNVVHLINVIFGVWYLYAVIPCRVVATAGRTLHGRCDRHNCCCQSHTHQRVSRDTSYGTGRGARCHCGRGGRNASELPACNNHNDACDSTQTPETSDTFWCHATQGTKRWVRDFAESVLSFCDSHRMLCTFCKVPHPDIYLLPFSVHFCKSGDRSARGSAVSMLSSEMQIALIF